MAFYFKLIKHVLFAALIFQSPAMPAQSYQFNNGNWWINKQFMVKTVYTVNGKFSFEKPNHIDSVVDLQAKFCIPPFGDAHTHNLDGGYNLKQMVANYLNDGVFYVQVLGNNGEGALIARPALEKAKKIDVTYANGLLTATYGHGFYPYEPLAMGIYAPYLQRRYEDSIKKSRIVENKAYYFLDSKNDVDEKWPLIMKYKPDHIKICLNDCKNYITKRKLERADDNGLSEEVAAYVVQKAHAMGLRVFAHIETADDARICAKIGVDVLAHLPGYYWDGTEATKEKYCMTKKDVQLFKKSGITVIPTININGTVKYDTAGNPIKNEANFLRAVHYKKSMLNALYKAKVPIALGGDYFGKTVEPEIDSLIHQNYFTNAQIIEIYAQSTPQSIFPKRKIGEIAEGFEASFLVLNGNPLLHIAAIKQISYRIRQGVFLKL